MSTEMKQTNANGLYEHQVRSMRGKKVILVVDDNKINSNILSEILVKEDYDVLQAENGREALDILTSDSSNVSLMLLDLSMPVMNGYELLDEMNERGIINSVPVIATTGTENSSAEIKCLEAGASDFLTKPYNAELVRHRVKSLLRLFENAAFINQLKTDALTGVLSKEFFYRHVAAVLEENPDEEYEIVCSNIENFKVINAKYGTEVGDKLLCCIADHNKACVGTSGLCGRIGADVFAVLRKKRELRSQEEIGKLFEETFKDAPVKNFLIQYGVYPVTDRSIRVATMCDCAQLAITSIKHKFGMYYAVYDDSISENLMREHQLNNYREQALVEKQFVVYLQPKHNTRTHEIAGAEALVRWIHPELGFISPGEFVPLFENDGFISKLDQYVWEEVCRILYRWQAEGRKLIPISVNASRSDFLQENLIDGICEMVERYDIPAEMIHFEVTESAYTDNPQQIISAVSALRSFGFKIEMDDFGSGYSSLNMLSELPIDILKLDMNFMKSSGCAIPGGKRSILSFIVSLSKWMQLPTIAEGVETEDEVALLHAMGCDFIQGYYFAKPMPVSEFEDYVESYAEKCSRSVQGGEHAGSSAADNADMDKALVLVVDDIETNCETLRQILSPKYKVATACNGEEAYTFIKKNVAELSCITLDLLMPVMDGFQLLDKLRGEGILDKIPVIITSEAGADSELRALHLGADDFVAKPYNAELILHHVKRAVDVCKLRAINGLGR